MKLEGSLKIIIRDPSGAIKDTLDWSGNLVTNAGFAATASRVNGNGSEAVFTTLALGTGTTAAAAADTTLETEITDSGLARGAATVGRETTTVANDTATWDKTWTASGTKAVAECGVLNNVVSGGTLLAHKVFAVLNVSSGDTIQVVYKIAFS